MSIERADILKFGFYFVFFSVFLCGFDLVRGPTGETAYDSASIDRHEEGGESVAVPTVESKSVAPLALSSVEFHPVVESAPATDAGSPSGTATAPIVTSNESPPASEAAGASIELAPAGTKAKPLLLQVLRATLDSPKWGALIRPVTVVLDADRVDPRGQNIGRKITLSLKISGRIETMKVLVHELGHVIDVQYFQKNTFGFDRSDNFYGISWKTPTVKKDEAKVADFVSGYALTNRYEDFAESFAFYVFHNDDFRARANTNDALRKKYAFFQRYVFPDGSFEYTDFGLSDTVGYLWDTTKITIDEKKYLFYISK